MTSVAGQDAAGAAAVLYAVDQRIATITLDRPQANNPLSPDVVAELIRLIREADRDTAVKCIVIQANGPHFSAGGNVKSFNETVDLPPQERFDLFERRVTVANRLPQALLDTGKPVIAAPRGGVFGAGLALCLAADFVIAADNAFFVVAQVQVGLSVDCGLSGLLVAAMGIKQAKQMVLLGDKVSAAEAQTLGIVTRVVAAAEHGVQVAQLAARLANGPALALATSKYLLNNAALNGFADVLAREVQGIAKCFASEDFRKGVEAAINKKSPSFD